MHLFLIKILSRTILLLNIFQPSIARLRQIKISTIKHHLHILALRSAVVHEIIRLHASVRTVCPFRQYFCVPFTASVSENLVPRMHAVRTVCDIIAWCGTVVRLRR